MQQHAIMRHIGNRFHPHVEIRAQETMYLVLQLSLRACTRSFVLINTLLCEERTFLLKSYDVLSDIARERHQYSV